MVGEPGGAETPNDGVVGIERRGQEAVGSGGEGVVGPAGAGKSPKVLEEAGGLGQGEEDKDGEGAAAGDVLTGEEREEGGDVVEDEEEVAGGEEEAVVEEVGEEVGDAVVDDGALGGGVGGGEASVLVGGDGADGEESGGGAVREGDEAAGGFGPPIGAPVSEHDEVADEVDGKEHRQEEREGWEGERFGYG